MKEQREFQLLSTPNLGAQLSLKISSWLQGSRPVMRSLRLFNIQTGQWERPSSYLG